jgi:hypothetical protein
MLGALLGVFSLPLDNPRPSNTLHQFFHLCNHLPGVENARLTSPVAFPPQKKSHEPPGFHLRCKMPYRPEPSDISPLFLQFASPQD